MAVIDTGSVCPVAAKYQVCWTDCALLVLVLNHSVNVSRSDAVFFAEVFLPVESRLVLLSLANTRYLVFACRAIMRAPIRSWLEIHAARSACALSSLALLSRASATDCWCITFRPTASAAVFADSSVCCRPELVRCLSSASGAEPIIPVVADSPAAFAVSLSRSA